MDHAAISLMGEYPDIVLGFGQSDEYRYHLISPNLTQSASTVHPLQLVSYFAKARSCTTDGDQKSRLFYAPISHPHTL
jgi:hypothetical protein